MRLALLLMLGMCMPPLATVAAEGAGVANPDKATGELTEVERSFQDVWDYTSHVSGRRLGTLRIEGREFDADIIHGRYKGYVTIRSDTSPTQIDFTIEDCGCKFEHVTTAGIYYEEDGTIVFATPAPGESRPTTFTNLDETSHEIIRLRRPEPAEGEGSR